MSSAVIQLIVLAGIAIFLILRLRGVLGTREGFEKPEVPIDSTLKPAPAARPGLEVIEGGADADITDHVPAESPSAKALAAMKVAERAFSVTDFLRGARGAYEMILSAFDRGALDTILPFLSRDVYESFVQVVEEREAKGHKVQSTFIGIRELTLIKATFNHETQDAEVTIRFVAEQNSCVRDAEDRIVEGNPTEVKRQKDVWTFARRMGADNPNWQLVATGE